MPSCYKYPLYFRHSDGTVNVKQTIKHIRAASRYFSRSKHMYPPDARAQIAKNIDKAKRQFGVGEYRKPKPPKVVRLFPRKKVVRPIRKAA